MKLLPVCDNKGDIWLVDLAKVVGFGPSYTKGKEEYFRIIVQGQPTNFYAKESTVQKWEESNIFKIVD